MKRKPCHRAYTVLLVEDNPDLREVLGTALRLKGYSVASAADGIEALSRMKGRAHLPDLVITDLQMPGGGDGWSLRRSMLDDAELATVPVVIMSAIAPGDTEQSLHAVAYLEKPVILDELLEVIEENVGPDRCGGP